MKDCMFQYATSREVVADTGLITREKAEELFEQYRERFIDDLNQGREPEMAIWIDCETEGAYAETTKHWIADDFIYQDGFLYQRV